MRGFSGVSGCGLGTRGQDRLGDLDAVERVDVDAGTLEKGEGGRGKMLEGSSSLIRMMGMREGVFLPVRRWSRSSRTGPGIGHRGRQRRR